MFLTEAEAEVTGMLAGCLKKFRIEDLELPRQYTKYFDAISHLYAAKDLREVYKEESEGCGLALGHCETAKEILSELENTSDLKLKDNVEEIRQILEELHDQIEQDNNKIYREMVVTDKKKLKIEPFHDKVQPKEMEELSSPGPSEEETKVDPKIDEPCKYIQFPYFINIFEVSHV